MTVGTTASVRWIQFPQHSQNGVLSVFAAGDPNSVPFSIARIFTTAGVGAGGQRANHAHRKCSELLVALQGKANVVINDTASTASFKLCADGRGLLIPPRLWTTVVFDGPQTVLMVICDEPYDPEDYIRDWKEFLRLAGHAE